MTSKKCLGYIPKIIGIALLMMLALPALAFPAAGAVNVEKYMPGEVIAGTIYDPQDE
jgi:hypothetical protein